MGTAPWTTFQKAVPVTTRDLLSRDHPIGDPSLAMSRCWNFSEWILRMMRVFFFSERHARISTYSILGYAYPRASVFDVRSWSKFPNGWKIPRKTGVFKVLKQQLEIQKSYLKMSKAAHCIIRGRRSGGHLTCLLETRSGAAHEGGQRISVSPLLMHKVHTTTLDGYVDSSRKAMPGTTIW